MCFSIVLRSWSKDLTVVFRNSSLENREYHSCQQPAPVVDQVMKVVFLLSSLDNWHQRLQNSSDAGLTWTPWSQARDLDSSLRRPGWGLIFTGLPVGDLNAPRIETDLLTLFVFCNTKV